MIVETGQIQKLIDRGAIFYVSHSAGKDSQAMYLLLSQIVPHRQLCVVHADLGEIEWIGVQEHIQATIHHPLNVVSAQKTFFDMVRHRAKIRPDVPSWPSSATRQCTSDLKRGPIYKFIRADIKARGALLALNCTGIRAAESTARKKKNPFQPNKMLSKAGREIYDYMPIHHFSDSQVFACIASFQQKPFWAYRRNKRLSCVFCIMGCQNDLQHGAEQRPDLYQKYLDLEKETGWTMFNGMSLAEATYGETQINEVA
jgi:3'-phosphoadenosine 5'-phosphosulfate sulfotransferase (PAPS reductase)/FAD synthetase